MKTLYLDIFSGISGDMFIGALIDLGVSEHQIKYKVAELGVDGYRINVARKEKSGIAGVKFDVELELEHAHEHSHEHGHPHPHPHERPHVKGKSHPTGTQILNASFTKLPPAPAKPTSDEHTHHVERNFTGICELISAVLSKETRAHVEAARAGSRPDPAEAPASLLVTSFARFGIERASPMLPADQVCVLAVGTVIEEPIVEAGAVAIGKTLTLTLAFDPTAVGGAVAAQLLAAIRVHLEDPLSMML